ncbi:glycoside hydrolase family 28 protein [Zymobacter sp. IVIA_5232.4 C2]|uniref:glycoside hydrolase family 28 protein n=1 Tax=Zymobacter sp. IVIA_5232.4 C2 TaxID=3394855 RepID=UPI0039C3B50D
MTEQHASHSFANVLRTTALGSLAIAGLIDVTAAHAADTRKVAEPVAPAICSSLAGTSTDATAAIQKALNACPAGKAVRLASGTFLSGPITIPTGRSLIVNKGAVLRAVNRASSFDNGSKTCGTLNGDGKGCKPLITIKGAKNSGIYGEGIIDGQGGVKLSDKGTTWWQLAANAKVQKKKQNAPRLIQIDNSQNITLHKITLKNSPNFHVVFKQGNGLTAWGVTINTPATARNTDGIDPISSQNVTVARSNISTGDDNVAIKANPGAGASRNMSFLNNTFGAGHGMSIGSETKDGVYDIHVNTLTMNGTTNGLRIKSDKSASGEVARVYYDHVTMANVKNQIVMDTVYENKAGSTKANWHDVYYNDVRSTTKGAVILNGTNASSTLKPTMKSVNLAAGTTWTLKNASIIK